MPPPAPAPATNAAAAPPAAPAAASTAAPSWAAGAGSDFSHYNSKLTVEDFDLLKVCLTIYFTVFSQRSSTRRFLISRLIVISHTLMNKIIQVLGKGSFGKVMLVKKKDDATGTLYAMKTLRKAALIKRNQLAHTSTERTILQNIHCPFLVHLVYAFQTADKLYMVLDYMGGGELFFWLKKDRKFSENRVRLYTAEITLALEALHVADIVYRDLKPENIL
jgi:serine/threonine protein kinase